MVKKNKEIGSEFWDVPTNKKNNNLFPKSIKWFLSGRSALQAIIKELKDCHTVAMPSWCCDSMIKPFIDAGLEVSFYPVYYRNGLIQEIQLDSDVLFIMDYFGYTGKLVDLKKYNGVVIRDVTHSIFSFTYSDADFYFGSLRKWCGVWTGGYAWTRDGHILMAKIDANYSYVALRRMAMQLKDRFISGYVDNTVNTVSNKSFLEIFDAAEKYLEDIEIASASERDIGLIEKLDIDFIKNRRRANEKVLRSAFQDWFVFREIKDADCPMFVPVIVPDGRRDMLQRFLIKNDIYCPVHWPISKYHKLDNMSKAIYTNELSLICDQRYTEEDMFRMVKMIKMFWKEL